MIPRPTFTSMVLGIYKENKAVFVMYMLSLLLLPLKDVLIPHLIGRLYNHVRQRDTLSVRYLTIWILVACVLVQVSHIFSEFVNHDLLPAVVKYVRVVTLQYQYEMNSSNYNDVDVSYLLVPMAKLPTQFFTLIDLIKDSIIPKCATLLVIWIYVIYKDFKLGAFLGIILVVVFITLIFGTNSCVAYSIQRDESHSILYGGVGEVMSNMKTILSFNSYKDETDRLDTMHDVFAKDSKKVLKCNLVSSYIIFPLILVYIATLILSTRLFKKTDLFISLIVMAFILLSSVDTLTGAMEAYTVRWGAIQNSLDSITKKDINEPSTNDGFKHEKEEHTGDIRFVNVSFSYPGTTKAIFTNLNVTIKEQEVTVLMGEIGSGKSTLFELLAGFQTPTQGAIMWPHTGRMSTEEIRKMVFQMPQTPRLFNRTVYENIVYGIPKDQIPGKEALQQFMIHDLGLGEYLNTLSNGLDTQVGVHGSSLSGGQRQIVWFIKLFIIEPRVILLDEPTASLDEKTKEWIFKLFEKLVGNKENRNTVIIITHDPFLLQFANNIIKLE